jgi:tetratricopeptide (TPR) repeat protein
MVQSHILASYYNKCGAESLADGEPGNAASFFERSIAVSPENPDLFDRSEVYTNLGWSLVEQGYSGEAEQKFRTALAINNDPRRQGGDAAANRDRSAYTYVTWGLMLSRHNNHDGAIEKFQAAIRANPKYVYAYVSWANALRERKVHDKAIEKRKKALDIDPGYDYAHVVWGDILLSNALALADRESKKKKLEEAAVQFREAIKVNRNYALGYVSLGRVLQEGDKSDAALANFQKAAEVDPKYGRVYVYSGDVLDRKSDYRGAAAKFQKATEVRPNHDYAYVRWGEILAKQSDYDGAFAKFEKALEVHPDYDFAYLAWGRVLLDRQKAPAAAIEKFKKA